MHLLNLVLLLRDCHVPCQIKNRLHKKCPAKLLLQEWRSRSKRELAELDSQMLAKMLLNAERGFDNWT